MFFCGYTADYDKKLTFDIEKFLDTRAKLHPKDEFFVVSAEDQEVKKMQMKTEYRIRSPTLAGSLQRAGT